MSMFKSHASTFFIALSLLSLGCGEGADRPVANGPNVLLITMDTTRADRFGAYGYDRPTTPRLDALAAEGTLFESAISVSGCTPPAHASIMTGLYPFHHGLRVIYAGSGYRLDSRIPTLATRLKEAGWATGAFLSSFTVSEYFGFDHGHEHWDNGLRRSAEKVPNIGTNSMSWDVNKNQRRSDETVDRALDWIRAQDGSFYAWVHLWDPHDEKLEPPDDWLERFPPRDRQNRKTEVYDAEIAYTDHNIGRLLDGLKELGNYEDTIIVVVADHGQGLGDHGWIHHRLLYQEQIHVPLIVRSADVGKARRVANLVRVVDILPTVLELVELPPGDGQLDGRSLVALMNGEEEPPRWAYAEQLNEWDQNSFMPTQRPLDRLLYSIVTEDWKLIHRDTAESQSQLFQLSIDPRELDDRYAEEPGVAAELRRQLDELDAYRRAPFDEAMDEEALERLRSLGYVGGDDR